MNIPAELFHNDTAHRSLSADPVNGILSCGFLVKPTDRFSHDTMLFSHYGAFLLLSGSGRYSDPSGREVELTPGCFVQRMPGKPHVTEVTPDGKWLEFYVCFGRDYFTYMADQGLLSRQPVLFHSLTQTALQERLTGWDDALTWASELLCLPGEEGYPFPVAVAEQMGMEYETFRKRFRAAFGCPPSAYQMQYRLNESKRLLLDTHLSVQEIADTCCFSDGFAYSKAFRRFYGLSPVQFRKSFSYFV